MSHITIDEKRASAWEVFQLRNKGYVFLDKQTGRKIEKLEMFNDFYGTSDEYILDKISTGNHWRYGRIEKPGWKDGWLLEPPNSKPNKDKA